VPHTKQEKRRVEGAEKRKGKEAERKDRERGRVEEEV